METLLPVADQVASYQRRLEEIETDLQATADPALAPLTAQLANHLKHVSYSFRIAGNTEDYPYDLQREAAFPAGHTEWALQRTNRLFDMLGGEAVSAEPRVRFSPELGREARDKQHEVV